MVSNQVCMLFQLRDSNFRLYIPSRFGYGSSFAIVLSRPRFDMLMLAPEILFFVNLFMSDSDDGESDPAASGVLRALRARRLVRLIRFARVMRFRKVMTLLKKFSFYKFFRTRSKNMEKTWKNIEQIQTVSNGSEQSAMSNNHHKPQN